MNWDQVEGKWKQLTASIGRIQERYGIAKDEARRQVSQWSVELSHEGGDQRGSLVERQAG